MKKLMRIIHPLYQNRKIFRPFHNNKSTYQKQLTQYPLFA
jgi:hypothetical protein